MFDLILFLLCWSAIVIVLSVSAALWCMKHRNDPIEPVSFFEVDRGELVEHKTAP